MKPIRNLENYTRSYETELNNARLAHWQLKREYQDGHISLDEFRRRDAPFKTLIYGLARGAT